MRIILILISDNHENFRSKKANIVLPITKPHPFGLPFSFADIQSSHLDEGITAMMTTISMRDTAQNLPVYLAQRFAYQIVPLPRVPLSVSRKFYLKKKYTFSLDHHLKKNGN